MFINFAFAVLFGLWSQFLFKGPSHCYRTFLSFPYNLHEHLFEPKWWNTPGRRVSMLLSDPGKPTDGGWKEWRVEESVCSRSRCLGVGSGAARRPRLWSGHLLSLPHSHRFPFGAIRAPAPWSCRYIQGGAQVRLQLSDGKWCST